MRHCAGGCTRHADPGRRRRRDAFRLWRRGRRRRRARVRVRGAGSVANRRGRRAARALHANGRVVVKHHAAAAPSPPKVTRPYEPRKDSSFQTDNNNKRIKWIKSRGANGNQVGAVLSLPRCPAEGGQGGAQAACREASAIKSPFCCCFQPTAAQGVGPSWIVLPCCSARTRGCCAPNTPMISTAVTAATGDTERRGGRGRSRRGWRRPKPPRRPAWRGSCTPSWPAPVPCSAACPLPVLHQAVIATTLTTCTSTGGP